MEQQPGTGKRSKMYPAVKKAGAAGRAFVLQHRAGLVLLLAGLLGIALFQAAKRNAGAMAWWVAHGSMPYKRLAAALVDPLPLSSCEVGATLLALAVLAGLARVFRRPRGGWPARFLAWLLHVCTAGVWIYGGVCAFWGTQYYVPTFAQQAGMQSAAVSTEALTSVTAYFAARVNGTAYTVPRNADGTYAVSRRELLRQYGMVYDGLESEYPFLAGTSRRPKPAVYSKIMSAAGFTGYICPLFGETTLNVDCPAVFLGPTIAHEIAHQRGVAAELEANYCAVEACVTSGNRNWAYAGWLFGYLYLSNALYESDRAAADASYAALCDAAKADLRQNNRYWDQWEGPTKQAGETVYSGMLSGFDQPLGMKSYGACVDLLVERYAAQAGAGAQP